MKIVIDISDEEYKTLSELSEKEKVNELSYYERVLANGIPYEERPKGEWLKNCENCDCTHCYESGHRFIRKDCSGTCSVCGVYSCCTDNYCSNCGAQMVGDPK